jgi:hypothetical protein
MLEMLQVIRNVLLCMLEAVEGEIYLLEGTGDTGDTVEETCLLRGAGAAGATAGHAPCAALYARGCGGQAGEMSSMVYKSGGQQRCECNFPGSRCQQSSAAAATRD